MPYAVIADALDIPLGTVKSRLHAAVASFAKQWERAAAGAKQDQ
jgi:DNA-directed RNA polymerase specialized sigma24 family protein